MGVAPLLAWQRGRLLVRQVLPMAVVAGVGCVIVVAAGWQTRSLLPALATIGLAVWVLGGLVVKLKQWLAIRHASLSDWGMLVAHAGVGLFALGVVGTNFFASETIARLAVGEAVALTSFRGETRYVLRAVTPTQGANYVATTAIIDRYDSPTAQPQSMASEIRRYPAEGGQSTTEAAIASHIFGDSYVVFGGGSVADGFIVRVYHKPLVNWLWAGAGLMALGGVLAWGGTRKQTSTKNQRLAAHPGVG